MELTYRKTIRYCAKGTGCKSAKLQALKDISAETINVNKRINKHVIDKYIITSEELNLHRNKLHLLFYDYNQMQIK